MALRHLLFQLRGSAGVDNPIQARRIWEEGKISAERRVDCNDDHVSACHGRHSGMCLNRAAALLERRVRAVAKFEAVIAAQKSDMSRLRDLMENAVSFR